MDKNGKMRAAEWALKRHNQGKSKLSPYQLRNIRKSLSLVKNETATDGKIKPKISSEDLAEFKKLTTRANMILNKYT